MPPEPLRIRCGCGSDVDGPHGRPAACPACGRGIVPVWASDGRGGRLAARADGLRFPAGTSEVRCDCGQPLVARPRHVGAAVRCPVCGLGLALELFRDPQTLETRVRRPAVRGPRRPSLAGQDLLCACGESLRVTADHLGKQAQCPACGALIRLETARDPQTHRTELRARFVPPAARP